MSSEIRAGNKRTYWILHNGAGYIDGITDPGQITTVGNGWYVYWVGDIKEEYIKTCISIGIIPRNIEVTITVDNQKVVVDPLSLINDIKIQIDELKDKNNIIEHIDKTIPTIQQTLTSINTVIPGQRISARQARLWLIQNGVNLSTIYDVIDGIEDPIIRESVRVEWEYATYVERSYPWLGVLAAELGFSEEDLDRAFQEAPLL